MSYELDDLEGLKMESKILSKVLHEYSRMAINFHTNKKWNEMPESELWQELCLCILSSNVPFESAQSAFVHLSSIGYLKPEWITTMPDSKELIASELSRPIYLPKKLDGSFRRYRFPNIRSKNICRSAERVFSEERFLSKLLRISTSEKVAREFLVSNISGIGLKEASHFLRNIRYSKRLAIIDSHVVSFLVEIEAVPQEHIKAITPRLYFEFESRLQELCDQHGLDLSIFDMAIWHCMRRK